MNMSILYSTEVELKKKLKIKKSKNNEFSVPSSG